MKHFKTYKTTRHAKIAIFFMCIFDWCRLKLHGDKILSQKYIISTNFFNEIIICRLIMTKRMYNDIMSFKNSEDINDNIEDALYEKGWCKACNGHIQPHTRGKKIISKK